jgi:hypothetical protein
MMKSKVYVETTIVSYLVAGPTKDIIQAAHSRSPGSGGPAVTDSMSLSRVQSSPRPAGVMRRRRLAAFGFFGASPGWPVAAAGPSWRRRYFVREHCRKGLKSTRCTLGLRRSTGSTTY